MSRLKNKKHLVKSDPDPLTGKWIQIYTSTIANTARTSIYGRVLDADGAFLYLEQPDSEQITVPRDSIRELRVLDVAPPISGPPLLRPADAPPSEDTLLRSTKGSALDRSDRYLRAFDPED